MTRGYGSAAYAASFSDLGTPRFLDGSGGWILERPIEGLPYHDAMGCYPIFVCDDWSRLQEDLDRVGGLICLSLVTDPFGNYDPVILQRCFPNLVNSFKEHFVIDLNQAYETFVDSHHRRNAHKALSKINVTECANPPDILDEWINLYGHLIKRHNIYGVQLFSRELFSRQLGVPGIRVFKASAGDTTVGMIWWYEQGNRSYYHLASYNDVGYELGASFALFEHSIKYFAQRGFEWLSLGGGAGIESKDSGLSRFKAGWSTGTRTAFICGRIFDQTRYDEVVLARSVSETNYFPAYRLGEFG